MKIEKSGAWLGIFLLSSVAQAAPFGMVYTRQFSIERKMLEKAVPEVSPRTPRAKLLYHGGPVIPKAQLYAVYWGSSVDATTQAGMGAMLAAIVDSTYFDLLTQYDTSITAVNGRAGTNQHFSRGAFLGQYVIQPYNNKLQITDDEIGAELERQIQAGSLPAPNANTVYMLYFPPGLTIDLMGALSCKVFCGYHHNYASQAYGSIYYTVQPDMGGACSFGCGAMPNSFDDLTVVTSHELMEAVTDPASNGSGEPDYPDAWNTSDGEEIGDLCASDFTKLELGNGSTFQIQEAYDNSSAACSRGPFQSP